MSSSRLARLAIHLEDEVAEEAAPGEDVLSEADESSEYYDEESEESEDGEPMTIERYLEEQAERSAVEVYTRMESFHTLYVRRDQRRILIAVHRAKMGDLFFHSLTLTGEEGSLPDMFNETASNAGMHFVVAPNGVDIWLSEAQPADTPSDFAASIYDSRSGGLQSGFRRSYRPLVDDVENGMFLLDITQWLLGFSKYVTGGGGGHREGPGAEERALQRLQPRRRRRRRRRRRNRHRHRANAEPDAPVAPEEEPEGEPSGGDSDPPPEPVPKRKKKPKRKPAPIPGGPNGDSVVLIEACAFPKNFLLRIAVQRDGFGATPLRKQRYQSGGSSRSRVPTPHAGCGGGACCGVSMPGTAHGATHVATHGGSVSSGGIKAMFGFGGPPPSGTAYFTASFGLLPKVAMVPRVWDRRVGYFLSDIRVGGPRDVTKSQKVIHRWSLDRNPWVDDVDDSPPSAAEALSLSAPPSAGEADEVGEERVSSAVAAPSLPLRSRLDSSAHGCISFYIDPHVPALFRGTIKKGVLAWNAAFEKVGQRGPDGRGVMRCFAPGDEGWPVDYALGDLRYNSIFMTNPAMAGLYGYGPSLVDYRSGEILVGSVLLGFDAFVQFTAAHNTDQLNRVRSKRFEAFNMSPLLPVDHPDVHRKLLFTTIHEIGHNLGLRHNFISAEEGHTSIMDYPDANDTSDPTAAAVCGHLLGAPGVYDDYAIRYGYAPLLGERRGARHGALEALAAGHDASAIVSPPAGSRYVDGMLVFPPENPLFGTDGDAHGGIDPRINTHHHDVAGMGRDKIQFLAHRRAALLELVEGGAITPSTYREKLMSAVRGATGKVTFCSAWVGARLINRARTASYVPRPQHVADLVRAVLDLSLGASLRSDARELQHTCGAHAYDTYGAGTAHDPLKMHRKAVDGLFSELLERSKLQRLEQHAPELMNAAHHATTARVGGGILPDAAETGGGRHPAGPIGTFDLLKSLAFGCGDEAEGLFAPLRSVAAVAAAAEEQGADSSTGCTQCDIEACGLDPFRSQARLLFAAQVNTLAFGKASIRSSPAVSAAARAFVEEAVAAFDEVRARAAVAAETGAAGSGNDAAPDLTITIREYNPHRSVHSAASESEVATAAHAKGHRKTAAAGPPLRSIAPVARAQWELTFEVLQQRPKEEGGGGGIDLSLLFGGREAKL